MDWSPQTTDQLYDELVDDSNQDITFMLVDISSVRVVYIDILYIDILYIDIPR